MSIGEWRLSKIFYRSQSSRVGIYWTLRSNPHHDNHSYWD